MGGVRVARAQHGGQGKPADSVEDQQWVEHVLVEVAVEQAQLLAPMGGIVGGVDVQDDQIPGPRMGRQIGIHQGVAQATQLGAGDPVLQPGQGGLGGQILLGERGAPHGGLQRRVAAQRGMVVGVFVALGNGEDPLAQQVQLRMADLGAIAGIGDRRIGPGHDAGAPVDLAQQKTAGVGGDVAALEVDDDGLAFEVCEGELGMTDCFQRAHLAISVFPSQINTLEGARCFVYALS